jgi:1,4-dihydroxy-2-naphthoate octaprenyltransferase
MASIQAWVKAARLRTLPLAVTCVMIGGALGFSVNPEASITVLMLAMLTVVKLQTLSNFANDYGDFKKGADEGREDRALAAGDITPEEMRSKIIISSITVLVLGSLTIYFAFIDVGINWGALGLFSAGIAGIAAALKYTIGRGAFGYRGLGDLFVLVFFGYVGVLGVAFLLTHTFEWIWLLPATFSGLMATAVLNLNNMRDHVSDRLAGKNTLVVKMGYEKGKMYHLALVIGAWVCMMPFLYGVFSGEVWRGGLWYMLIALVQGRHLAFVIKTEEPSVLDGELKKVALTTFVVGLFMLLTWLS